MLQSTTSSSKSILMIGKYFFSFLKATFELAAPDNGEEDGKRRTCTIYE